MAAAAVAVAVVVADVAGNSAFHTRQWSPGEFTLSGALVFVVSRRCLRVSEPPCLCVRSSLRESESFAHRDTEAQSHAARPLLVRIPGLRA